MNGFLSPLSFTRFVSCVIPGFIMLMSMKYFSPLINKIFISCFEKEIALAMVALILMMSIILGVIIDPIRSILMESWLSLLMKEPKKYAAKFKNEEFIKAYGFINEGKYRFAQGYGNTTLAMFILFYERTQSFKFDIISFYTITLATILMIAYIWTLHETYQSIKQII